MNKCTYVFARGHNKGSVCGKDRCEHKALYYPVVYMNYYASVPFIRFYDGVRCYDKKYTNLYNNSCMNVYLPRYHHMIGNGVMMYNVLKVYLGDEYYDIFINVGNFIVRDYLQL